jgi:TonB family protein
MHTRLLTAISFVAGAGITLCIFLTISRFLRMQEETPPATLVSDDLDKIAVALPPPPPPPRAEEPMPAVTELSENIPLGFAEAPSDSPVKLSPSPPDFEKLLPMSQTPTQVAARAISLDLSFKPAMDVTFDVDRVFQRSEVDKPPVVLSRSMPDVPITILGDTGSRSVVVLFVVDAHGAPGKVRILQSSNDAEFDALIAENIPEWTFAPAIKKGRPVRCIVQQRITVQRPHRDILSL